MVAEAAYDALMDLDHQVRAGTLRKIRSVHFVNLDAEVTRIFTEVFSNRHLRWQTAQPTAGADVDISPDVDGANADLVGSSQSDVVVDRHLAVCSVSKSHGGKRQRRLKKRATEECGSAAQADTSKIQKMTGDNSYCLPYVKL